jgi:hypothetical protein
MPVHPYSKKEISKDGVYLRYFGIIIIISIIEPLHHTKDKPSRPGFASASTFFIRNADADLGMWPSGHPKL